MSRHRQPSATAQPHAGLELGPNPFLQYGVPVFVASFGLLTALVLSLVPSQDGFLPRAGLMVLAVDAASALILWRIFGSQSVAAGEHGITLRNLFGDRTIAWSEIHSWNRVASRGDIQFRVYDCEGRQTGRWSGYLGTRESREALTALLDRKTSGRRP